MGGMGALGGMALLLGGGARGRGGGVSLHLTEHRKGKRLSLTWLGPVRVRGGGERRRGLCLLR
jgi:hypothetical protein